MFHLIFVSNDVLPSAIPVLRFKAAPKGCFPVLRGVEMLLSWFCK